MPNPENQRAGLKGLRPALFIFSLMGLFFYCTVKLVVAPAVAALPDPLVDALTV